MTSFDIDLNTNSMCTLKVTVRLMHNETYYNHTMPMIFTVILVEYCFSNKYISYINQPNNSVRRQEVRSELSGAISKWKSSLQQQSIPSLHKDIIITLNLN
jgi:hypothetical protein